jgi:hypothetical protein
MEPVTIGAAVAGLLGLLAALPKIIGFLEQGIGAIVSMAEAMHRNAAAREMANAIEKAKITKNTQDLEAIFNPRPKP